MCDNQRNTLRTGITTGTCAAGAAKASAIFITTGQAPEIVSVKNLEGHEFKLKVFHENKNTFGVIKYSGDDKADITDGTKILASVEVLDDILAPAIDLAGKSKHIENKINSALGKDLASCVVDYDGKIIFSAGEGVGVVTLPGLKVAPGEPAINPVPREMIARAVREIIPCKSVRVIISVPNGRELAKKTFNPRLGIINGISILGTTGIVKPMNEKALLASLSLELNMIYSLGFRELFITFAGTGEKFTRKIFHVETRNIIQCGNYPGYVLDEAADLGFEHVIICGHPGKLLKLAAGSFNTHSKIADGRREALCTHLALLGAERDLIAKIFHSNTTNEAIDIVKSEGFNQVWSNIAEVIASKCETRINGIMKVDAVFIDNDGEILGQYAGAKV